MKRRLAIVLFALVVIPVGIACGDSGDEAEPTVAEKEYLDSAEEATALFTANFEKFGELFGRAWPLPSQLFRALEDAGAGAAFDTTLAALEELEPPERFEAEHRLLVSSMREAVSLDQVVGRSVVDQDVTAFVLANVALGQASIRGALRLSTAVCDAVGGRETDTTDTT